MLPLLKPALLVEMKALDPTAGPPAPWLASAKVTEGLHSDEVRMRPEPAALPLICPGRGGVEVATYLQSQFGVYFNKTLC